MRIGILDTKVNGQPIDNVSLYREKGYDIINASHLDQGKQFDIVATTWTRITEKRIKASAIKGIVIKDNDEPGNVVDVDVLKQLKVPYGLIGLWGISTRVNWNFAQMHKHKPNFDNVLMIADTPSHDAIRDELEIQGVTVNYPITPKNKDIFDIARLVKDADIVITHLGKDDFPRHWLDPLLDMMKKNALWISTTRGPLYRAAVVNRVVKEKKITAVLDWAWEQDKLIDDKHIIHTGHSSYRSAESGTELAREVIKAVERMKKRIAI